MRLCKKCFISKSLPAYIGSYLQGLLWLPKRKALIFWSLSLCKIIAMHIEEGYLKIALKLKIDRSLLGAALLPVVTSWLVHALSSSSL